ncbi:MULTISPECIES: type I glyceraldehyde-3-phosphate dehydrogenase [unclassified Oleiphilus]|uniref:type I glyceraldehyde-3-phosphate dehydrogenase n=4 Tax=Oleiphilus TaxID=141450 RepID=UPI0007C30D21|nr:MULTISPECIES: glyceraldehyde 3-phosphate dehydrogenase NAD-binding domain-containing protein [unclassified Oleiphilus]KZY45717.1 erythrose-4-phosphate dehydrogenase [Oleiphilus sp. HI0050]KZY83775.1 erythrose-4-phosphate dehydrogenase [Oleiphilus sp. HI0068]KZY88428.1 erythrose-4-phosphate dehydrogenase [Oleiphilus sp. HI0069]KZZ11336.1 erythrose-4-phosphate dehydrogenase [Oleiphilus sp. HI0078]KZZ21531.1 erythrose-4-phosphate dehydrogenase [Oleiphilus sp. HI0081]KZZ46568.1 erythrose-4-pho
MTYRVAINGYGRIGQSLLRASYERSKGRSVGDDSIKFVAINELADADTIAYLTRYDTTFGRFPLSVDVQGDSKMVVGNDLIALTRFSQPSMLPWEDLGIDLVMECTGRFSSLKQVSGHLESGAGRVLVSQPGDESFDKTVIYGVNHFGLDSGDIIASCASCTSNAVVPVLSAIDERFGIVAGSLTTIHSAMNDQPTIDAYHHQDLRRTRSSMNNVVPVDTGLAKGVERILPDLKGKLTATAMRVPTINVSAIELSLYVDMAVNTNDVNALLAEKAGADKFGIFHYTEEPLASSDFVGDTHSTIVDGSQTRVSGGRLIKVLTWFDNEWAYANRMLDVARYWLAK